jgi:branched-chain amino acid aminotransferase
MNEIAYLNGRFLPLIETRIPVSDSGFLYGYGCYETMRGYHGRFFHLNDHLSRLSLTSEILGIRVDLHSLGEIVQETLKRSEIEDSRIRVTLTGGEGNLYSVTGPAQNPTLVVTAVRYLPPSIKEYEQGYQAIIIPSSRNSHSLLPGLKTTCFLENILARRQAQSAGANDALLLNERGLLAEASSSNVFILSAGILKTPRLGNGLLPGVTRSILLDIARVSGIKTLETDIASEEVLVSDEIFLTNSMMEVMPVTRLEGQSIGSGKPGQITRKLMAAYKALVAKETG